MIDSQSTFFPNTIVGKYGRYQATLSKSFYYVLIQFCKCPGSKSIFSNSTLFKGNKKRVPNTITLASPRIYVLFYDFHNVLFNIWFESAPLVAAWACPAISFFFDHILTAHTGPDIFNISHSMSKLKCNPGPGNVEKSSLPSGFETYSISSF